MASEVQPRLFDMPTEMLTEVRLGGSVPLDVDELPAQGRVLFVGVGYIDGWGVKLAKDPPVGTVSVSMRRLVIVASEADLDWKLRDLLEGDA